MKITILGAGCFGTALGHNWARAGHNVNFWCIEPDVVHDINKRRRNRRYLRNVVLRGNVRASQDIQEALMGASVVVVCVASKYVESVMELAKPHIPKKAFVVNASKGFVDIERPTIPDLIKDVLPKYMSPRIAQISGPSFANEVAKGELTVMSLGMKSKANAIKLAKMLTTKTLFVSPVNDIVSVSLGGSMKNCYVIALGVSAELFGSVNTQAIIADASLKEMALMAKALGGNECTLMSPSGIGDFIATGFGGKSRNLEFGHTLGRTGSVRRAKRSISSTIEGIEAVKWVHKLAKHHKLHLPLANAIYKIIYLEKPPKAVMKRFLEREYRKM